MIYNIFYIYNNYIQYNLLLSKTQDISFKFSKVFDCGFCYSVCSKIIIETIKIKGGIILIE